ncbi:MAG: GTP-binding protein, partial [Lachnospiraceae bacterium]|nr:GTP-binding protein [Lachnospiraceae bacterium]
MEHRPDTTADKQKKRITTGIVAHVDAGKTTLSESILYIAGSIRKPGRVDTKDAFLDTYELERSRGITIFSKQARFSWKDMQITLVDTPGHVDFSAEMERTLCVLDYAILVISGADGVQGHTLTLWKLLERYDVPVFLFVNKMDQPGTDREKLMTELKSRLDSSCVDFTDLTSQQSLEDIASCDEETMETYFETGGIRDGQIRKLIRERRLFPCFFGSALRLTGVEAFLRGFARYTLAKVYPDEFGARIYKITRDMQGNRLTHLKITGGVLKAKTALAYFRPDTARKENTREEKVDQIRVYHGEKFELLQEARAGEICAVTGLTGTYPGQGLGFESEADVPVLEPVLSRQVLLPDGSDAGMMLPKLRMLEEELPELHIVWDERLQEIQAQVMGEVQTEVLSSLIEERFGVPVCFGPAHIVYRETITAPVEGVGHFEPLRNYAEVHL